MPPPIVVKRMQDLGAGEYIRKPYTLEEKSALAVRRELDRHKENALVIEN